MIKITKTHAFFYTEWPSNFRKTSFTWSLFGEAQHFWCTEQAFMWAKAKFFEDAEMAANILAEKTDPRKVKEYGRCVLGYDDFEWDKVRYRFMLEVNYARFSQDSVLKEKLLDPKFEGLTFVEASPIDKIWGIGIAQDDPRNEDPANWQGQNLMGKVITEVRRLLVDGHQPVPVEQEL